MASGGSIKALIACLDGRPPAVIDWPGVIAAANRTLTTGTLAARHLDGGAGATLPEDVERFLVTIHARTIARNARLSDQLAEALACLNRAGIRPILIKGIAAQLTLGAAARGRILSDLDLVVPPSSLADAIGALERIGYSLQSGGAGPDAPAVLARPEDVGMLDLHCRLKAPYPHFDHARIEPACAPIRVEDGEALLPSPTYQALVLILHDQLQDRDYWRGLIDLRHILDIAGLAKTETGIDWALLESLFPPGYPRSALHTQLLTARELLHVGVPERMVGGWWPHVQYRRRLVQARWPILMLPLTLLTLAIAPARRPGKDAEAPRRAARPPRNFTRGLGGLRRFSRPKASGKL